MTNFEKIKSMTIDEMAVHLYKIADIGAKKLWGQKIDTAKMTLLLKKWLECEVGECD